MHPLRTCDFHRPSMFDAHTEVGASSLGTITDWLGSELTPIITGAVTPPPAAVRLPAKDRLISYARENPLLAVSIGIGVLAVGLWVWREYA